ncbi:MAG: hypothetical protein ABS882_10250 [Lysinibacillus sp.]
MKRNFGKYDVPPTLHTLIELEKELGERELFYEGLHFYLSLTDFRYFNTPSDVIVFGYIGADGIHYGFLTDYGSVSELEEAPILCVSPMDFDQPTRLIAKNLREFLRINYTDDALFYNDFANEYSYIAFKAEQEVDNVLHPLSKLQLSNQTHIKNFLEENIQMPIIDNPYRYIQMIRLQRQKMVSIKTQDGLGVIAPPLAHDTHIPFEIHRDIELDLAALKAYFSIASIPSHYAIFRDIQLHYVLSDEPLLRKIVLESMLNIGLIDEAKRLS